ncbi:hypothetical protein C0Q70_19492 [Pomacea canaliculata]|uniref:Uncharacterized protein n=2 Tax=Pomacea canaliculata TaxID=400727 RepID=A0A2T7NJH7_POMCA|nr:hypothetical protein C0Q70_19492 [Pomacea canaliculata]
MLREQRSCDRKARRLAKDRESLSSLNYWNQSIDSNRLSKHSRSWHSEPSERLEHKLTLSKDSSSESDKSSQRWIQHETAKRDQKSQWSVSLQRHHGLDALGSSRSEKEMDFTKKELFMKFFSQEVDLDDTQSNEDPRFFSDSWTNSLESSVSTRKNSLKFIGHSSGDSEDTLQVVAVESSSGGAADCHSREFLTVSEPTPKCNVIVYADNLRSKHRTRSRTVSNHVSPARSPSSETNDDLPTRDVRAGSRVLASTVSNPNKSVPCAVPDAELSSGSSESVRTKVSEASTHLSVTDTDSALSSAASRQTTPSAPSTLHEEVTTTYPHVGKKYSDSAYQTKESSMDMFDDPRRKGSVTTLRGEDKKVTQRLHQAAVKLFVLQQRVRKGRLSRDSAVSTISEDEATMDNYEDLPVSYYPSFSKTGRRQTLLPEKLSGKTPRHHGITEEEEQETDLDLSVKDLSSAPELLPLSETQGQVLQLEQLTETVEV